MVLKEEGHKSINEPYNLPQDMSFSIIIGVDCASEKFDWHALNPQEVELGYAETKNTTAAIQVEFEELCLAHKVRPHQVLVCVLFTLSS